MKKITTLIVTMCITSICFAQGKKEVLLMIEAQNTTINSLNQQLSSLTAHQKKLEEQVKELQKQKNVTLQLKSEVHQILIPDM